MTNRFCGAIIPSDSKKEIIKGDFSYETHNKNYLRRFRPADALNLRRLRQQKGHCVRHQNKQQLHRRGRQAHIADKLGLELEIADVEFDSIIPGVQTGKYDMGMAGMTVTDERKKSVNFSDSYAKGVQVIIVKEGSDIKTKDDLNGKKIGTQQGTTGYIYASDTPENGGYGEENVVGYDSGTVAVEALKSGKVDCVIIDNEPAKAYVAANTGLKILDTEFANEDYAICFSKKNPELQKKVNDALNELKASGEFQKVVDKYIKAN